MYIAIGTTHGEISIWNSNEPKTLLRFQTDKHNRIVDIAWHDSGNLLFALGSNNTVYFISLLEAPKILSTKNFLESIMIVKLLNILDARKH